MEFLLDEDFNHALVGDALLTLQATDPTLALPAQKLALAEVRRSLASFDTDKALAPWRLYDPAQAYAAGQRIFSTDYGLFWARVDVPAGIVPEDGPFWAAGDNRLPELVDVVMRLTLFSLAQRLALSTVPAAVEAGVAQARAWLQAQSAGTAPALLPRLAGKGLPLIGSMPARADGRALW